MSSFKNGIIRKIKIFIIFLFSEVLAALLVISYILLIKAVEWVIHLISVEDQSFEFIVQASHIAGIALFIITTLMLSIELLFMLYSIYQESKGEIKGVCREE